MSVWEDARLGGRAGSKHMLGLWDPRHHMSALGWMPPASQRRQIFGKQRYQYALNVTLAGSSVGSDRVTVINDFWWTDTIASYQGNSGLSGSIAYPSFSVQLYDSRSGRVFMNNPEFVENVAGTDNAQFDFGFPAAQLSGFLSFPYFHRRITRIPSGAVMVGRFQNVSTKVGSLPFQLVLGGYTD